MLDRPCNIFFCVSTSERDRRLADQIQIHFGPKILSGQWNLVSRELLPGTDIVKGITDSIERADVALLLLSPEFFSDAEIYSRDLPLLLQRGLPMIPILAYDCPWTEHPVLRQRQIFPRDGRALAALDLPQRQTLLVELTQAVERILSTGSHRAEPTKIPAGSAQSPGRIYLSYVQEDSGIVHEIATALRGIGLAPWINLEQQRPGQSVVQVMNDGLAAASYVLLIASPAALTSRLIAREWMSTLSREGTVLLPVKVAACELPVLIGDLWTLDLVTERQKGIDRLLDFFRKELTATQFPDPGNGRGQDPDALPLLQNTNRRELRLVALRCLDEALFKAFLFDAGISEGRIGGSSLHERILHLLHIVGSDGILHQFADWLVLECDRCVAHQLKTLRGQQAWRL